MLKVPLISIKNMTKEYWPNAINSLVKRKKPTIVFQNASLDISNKTIIGINGVNGSGKTTLLKLLASLYLPSTGKILIGGYATDQFNKQAKMQVGASFNSERAFFRRMTGQENIDFFSTLNGISHNKDYVNNVEELLSLLGLESVYKERVERYSAGMKEKLGYLLSLLAPKDILIYDDFAKNLDDKAFKKLWFFLKEKLQSQWCEAIIISSPKLSFLTTLTDKIIYIEKRKFREINRYD